MALNIMENQIQLKYASFIERLAAYFFDGIVLFIFIYSIGYVIDLAGFLAAMISSQKILYNWGGSFIIWYFYDIIFWVYYDGATLGKKLMKIKIIKDNGESINYLTANIRFFSELILIFIPIINLLNYLSVIFSEKRQAWHDKIAKTIVINTEKA